MSFGGSRRGSRPLGARVREFVVRYGWRAYALPLLTALTVVALLQPTAARHGQGNEHLAQASSVAGTVRAPVGSHATAAAPPTLLVQGAADATACLRNTAATFVLVSISQQHVWMCEGHKQVYSSPATTGEVDNGNATPTGSWVVQSRETNRYLTGPGYRDYVHYWIPFDGDIGFHDATWQTMPFGSQRYRTEGSHGCVHLPLGVVRWLYGWAQSNSTVVTVAA